MTNQNKIILSFLGFILTVHFFVVPFFHKRQAARIVETVLALWQSGDLAPSFKYWQKEEDSPPVYGVLSYQILKKSFFVEDTRRAAMMNVYVDFSPGNFLKSGQWAFKLKHTKKGWKILSFKRLGDYTIK